MSEANATPTPKHGDERARRIETTTSEPVEFRDATTGKVVYYGPLTGLTQTVSERWCATCKDWVTAKGIIGAMICPHCHRAWFETDENAYLERVLKENEIKRAEPADWDA